MKKDNTDWIAKEIKILKNEGLFTNIKTIESPVGGRVTINGKVLLNFCSNNYLGLANDKRIKKAAIEAIEKYGVGPGAVRTIAGTMTLHDELEKSLAKFKKCESVIVLQSGFAANLATIPALVNKNDTIFSDELNHASIIDGCRLSGATVVRFAHTDANDLEKKLKKGESGRFLVITDGVFSMDGDIAPLDELYKVANKFGALLMVDDAHGEGVLGKNGRGIVSHFNLHEKVDIEIGTMSKAFGAVGGYVAGNKNVITWLKQRGRPFLFSSALTVPDTAASIEAVKILEKSDELVKKLWENAEYFKVKMNALKFDTGKTQTPIVPVMLGDAKLAQEFSKLLLDSGVFAMAIKYPTVPKGLARIRIMNTAIHTKKDLDEALSVFEKVGHKLKVLS